jgi:hypothetical protein
MKSYWLYRLVFFGCIVLSIALVFTTVSSRQRSAVRAEAAQRSRASAAARARDTRPPASVQPAVGARDAAAPLSSRVRITTVVPYRLEVEVYNFGDAAEDLSDWQLASPRAGGGEDTYVFPLGTVILGQEALVVVVDEGIDVPGELHWRVAGDHRVLDLGADVVALLDPKGAEVSRYSYVRR